MHAPSGAPDVGLIGGSGFYSFMEQPEHLVVDTPFGEPSAPVTVGTIANRRVAFLPRHGEHHQFPPHRINVRANLWALRSLGVRQVLATSAVGSLRADLGPGTFVVPDQVVDRTWGRAHTMYDGIGPVVHVSFANPYCPRGRSAALATGDPDMVDGGTLVVVNGPRFSSAAESQWHADQGWSIVGMTGQPEAALARELALCYTTIALVTDHDAGVQAGEAVTYAEVLRIFSTHVAKLSSLLHRLIPALPEAETDANATCVCRRALDGLALPFPLPGTTA